MKRLFTSLFILLFAQAVSAQLVALHSTSGVTHYSGPSAFVNAENDALAGDTIYIPGGSFNTTTIKKRLTIYGAGHYPDSTTATGITYLNGNLLLDNDADGTHIEGVRVSGQLRMIGDTVSDVTIMYTKFDSGMNLASSGGFTDNFNFIRSEVSGDISFGAAINCSFINSMINNRVFSCTQGALFENCIFFWGYGYSSQRTISGSYCIVRNCIFFNNDYVGIYNGVSNQSYNNIYVGNPAYAGLQSGNYTSVPQASVFVNHPSGYFSYSSDYHLQSPGTYLGTDGTQVGIYGGPFPYKDGEVPSNPHIRLKNISPTTNTNGELQIEIQVGAQDE